MNPRCHLLLLAAGASTRMGRPKQLLPFHGQPLVRHMAEQALHSMADTVTVVAGAKKEEIVAALEGMQLHLCHNEDWASGMGSSIATGVEAVLDRFPLSQAILVMLCDQVYVNTAHLNALMQRFDEQEEGACIVASHYQEQAGAPALFGQPFFDALKGLKGKKGAKPLFKQFREHVINLPFPKGSIDLDTPEDYEQWVN